MRRDWRALPSLIASAALLGAVLAGAPCVRAEEKAHSLQMRFEPSGMTPGGWGRASFRAVRRFRRLVIETHGLAPGFYDVFVGAGVVGSLEVPEEIGPDEASIFVLDSRQAGLLIFDPRGTSIEVVNQSNGMTELSIDEFPANKREEMEKTRIKIDFKTTDVQPAASGTTEFRSFKGRSRFVVKVAGLSPGTYELVIGGTPESFLRIVSLDGVELSFDTIPEESVDTVGDDAQGNDDQADEDLHRLLTFDPRGFPISLRLNGVDILSIDLYPVR